MTTPVISVLLITVRPDQGYAGRSDLHTLGTVYEDLTRQTFQDFELIVVDGLWLHRHEWFASFQNNPLSVVHIPPRDTRWTHNKKVAISTYRNSGLVYAHGELIVNLDDCCRLPPNYLETFWLAWKKYGYCAAATWRGRNDHRLPGIVTGPGQVYGFGSYPLSIALQLNGYCESYDGSQGLEDIDWSTRLYNSGVKQVLLALPGFDILPQTGHDPRAIDATRSLERCCNTSWQTQRVWRQVARANDPRLWEGVQGREALERLVGPCWYRDMRPANGEIPEVGGVDGKVTYCLHHGQRCPYVHLGFVHERTAIQEEFLKEPPVFDLAEARRENGL